MSGHSGDVEREQDPELITRTELFALIDATVEKTLSTRPHNPGHEGERCGNRVGAGRGGHVACRYGVRVYATGGHRKATSPSGAGPQRLGAMPQSELLVGVPTVANSTAESGSDSHRSSPPLSASVAASAPTVLNPAGLTATTPASQSSLSCTADGAATICNLLPGLGQARDTSSTAGIYVAEGLLPVPAKLAEKITR